MIWARPELVPRRRADKVSTGRPVFEAEDDVVVRLTGGEVRLVVQRGLPETRVNEWGIGARAKVGALNVHLR